MNIKQVKIEFQALSHIGETCFGGTIGSRCRQSTKSGDRGRNGNLAAIASPHVVKARHQTIGHPVEIDSKTLIKILKFQFARP